MWDQRESVDETETNLTDISLRFNYDLAPQLTYSLKTFYRNRNTDQGTYRSSLHSAGDEGINGVGVLIDTQYKQLLVEHIVNYQVLDNELLVQLTNSSSVPFDNPHYLLLNIAMGGTLGGSIPSSFSQDTMKVDYVRFYQ